MARYRQYKTVLLCSAVSLFFLLNLGLFTQRDVRGYLQLLASSSSSSSSLSPSLSSSSTNTADIVGLKRAAATTATATVKKNNSATVITTTEPTEKEQQQQQQQQHRSSPLLASASKPTLEEHHHYETQPPTRRHPPPQQTAQQQQTAVPQQQTAAPQQPTARPRLELVHIPKTGGTALEKAAAAANISWGICHYMIGQLANCPVTIENTHNMAALVPFSFRTLPPQSVPLWHLPPREFLWQASLARSSSSNSTNETSSSSSSSSSSATAFQLHHFDPYYYSSNNNSNNNSNVTTLFAVVRNPYDRVISEYFFQHEKMLHLSNKDVNNAQRFNEWLQVRLERMMMSMSTNNDSSSFYYYQDDGHFIPQFDYIYNHPTSSSSSLPPERLVHHVVYLERDLHDQLAPLLEQFGLQSVLQHLPKHHHHDNTTTSSSNGKTNKNKKTTVGHLGRITSELTRNDISVVNRRYMNQVYARDFQAFGYDMMMSDDNAASSIAAPPLPAATTIATSPSQSLRGRHRRRRLEMVHIPKTGGTAVGRAAAKAQISWSICHYMAGTLANCPTTQETKSHVLLFNNSKKKKNGNNNNLDSAFRILPPPRNVPVWHLPPRFFYNHNYSHTLAPYNPYGNISTTNSSSSSAAATASDASPSSPVLFVIVRNPYDRALSEYFFQQEKNAQITSEMVNDPQRMNAWLYQRLSKMVKPAFNNNKDNNSTTNTTTTVNTDLLNDSDDKYWYAYFQDDGHFIPQSDYVFDENDHRIVQHVVHMEKLAVQLPPLLKRYGLESIVLDKTTKQRVIATTPPAGTGGGGSSSNKTHVVGHLGRFESHLSAADLTIENQHLIESIYARDFSTFGYKKLVTTTT